MSDERAAKGRAKKRPKQGYLHKERALNMTVFDLGGKPIAPEVVEEILNTVNEMSLSRGLMFSYTQI